MISMHVSYISLSVRNAEENLTGGDCKDSRQSPLLEMLSHAYRKEVVVFVLLLLLAFYG